MSMTKEMKYGLYLEAYVNVITEMEGKMIPVLRKDHSAKMMRKNIVAWILACTAMIHRLASMASSDYPENKGVSEQERELILGSLKKLERTLLEHTTTKEEVSLEDALIDNGKLAECAQVTVDVFRRLYREAGQAERPTA